MLKQFPIIFSTLANIVLWHGTTWACSVCFGGASDAAMDGYNASVLFLMVTPYLVVGTIVGGLVFTYRRALKRREAEAAEPVVKLTWNQEESGR
ncbi:MAG TPA: hypothetical protein VHV54_07165 [Candidatus Binatia bacterium]|jgi:hypothetical protein|nr:hypothetical protein [Candidatus Binatia bacterium]